MEITHVIPFPSRLQQIPSINRKNESPYLNGDEFGDRYEGYSTREFKMEKVLTVISPNPPATSIHPAMLPFVYASYAVAEDFAGCR